MKKRLMMMMMMMTMPWISKAQCLLPNSFSVLYFLLWFCFVINMFSNADQSGEEDNKWFFFGVSLIETFPISCGQNNRILFTCIYTHCKWYNQSYYPLYCSVVFCTIQYSLLHMFRKTFSSGWLFIMLVSKVQCQHCKIPNLDTEVS